MKLQRTLMILVAAALAFAVMPSYGKESLPKAAKKIAKSVDEKNPVHAAVFAALESYDNGFEPLAGEPISPDDREQMIQDTLAFPAYDQSKSQMDRLREAEIMADSAREITVSIPDADGFYWEQEVVQPGATSRMKYVTWTFDVPFDQRVAFARDLYGRLGKIFRKDKKWMSARVEDPGMNSLYGQLMYTYPLNMMGSQGLQVTVEYGQTEKIHDLTHGVALRVYTYETRL